MRRSWIAIALLSFFLLAAGCSKKSGCPTLDDNRKMKDSGLFDKKMKR